MQEQSGVRDCLVLILHDFGESVEVGLFVGIVFVGQEVGDDAGRGGGHEEFFRLSLFSYRLEPADVPFDGGPVVPSDGSSAGRLGDIPG